MMLSVKNEDKRNEALQSLKVSNQKLKTHSEDLEQFAYIASHDLKEPLSNMIMISRLLHKKLQKLSVEGASHARHILKSATRMQALIDDLLTYSKSSLNKPLMAKVDLNAVLKSVQSILQATLKNKNVTLSCEVLPTIHGNFSQMEQVFQNLIENAIKYQLANSEAKINIYAKRDPQESMYLIHVEDNGIGIETDNIDDIFLPFKRLHTHKQYPGSGIGLSICKKIMLSHQGDIQAKSTANGSVFVLSIPMYN